MDRGFIKFYRKITESECFRDPYEFKTFFWLISEANHDDKRWCGRLIKRGQKLTSIRKMSAMLDMSDKTIQRVLKKLVEYGSIKTKSDKRGGTLITIINYDTYQIGVVNNTTQHTTQVTTRSTTDNTTQSTTVGTTKQELEELKNNNTTTTTRAQEPNFDKQKVLMDCLSDDDWVFSKSEEVMMPVDKVKECVTMFAAQIRNDEESDESTNRRDLEKHLTRWMRRNKSINLTNQQKVTNNGKAKYGYKNPNLKRYQDELAAEFADIIKSEGAEG